MIEDISNYKLKAKIRSSIDGCFYKAKRKADGTKVAIKMLFETPAYTDKIDEVDILRGLQHKNVIKLLGVVGDAEKAKYGIVFEYMDFDFDSILHKEPEALMDLKSSQLHFIMYQVLSGVAYLHKMCVIHRDISLSNIIINKNGIVKIADFETSMEYMVDEPELIQIVRVGSAWFQAPEIVGRAHTYSRSADIWSVGCVFLRLAILKYICSVKNRRISYMEKVLQLPTSDELEGKDLVQIEWNHVQMLGSRFFVSGLKRFDIKYHTFCLIGRMLRFDPDDRITASAALKHQCVRNFKKFYVTQHYRASLARWVERKILLF